MVSIDEINLRNSLLGFANTHKELIYVKNHNILMRDDVDFKNDENSVLIISGGGSGHEPFPSGFVGKGLLSAAICGEIFTSPSVASCLASILITSKNNPNREILMVINNYTGDRLNFGLAIEMAKNIHKYQSIKTVIIDDDCAIDNPRNSTGRRGLTGINLIIKIAGAMSMTGCSLADIHQQCTAILDNRLIRTIGFTFQHNINELNQIDIGYGIHGEPGALKLNKTGSFKSIISVLMKKLQLMDVKSDIIVLFNNLGGASDYIFYHFIRNFMDSIKEFPINPINIYAGKFLTSLGKEGIGVSIMEVRDNSILKLLQMPVYAPAADLYAPLNYAPSPEIEFSIPKVIEQVPQTQADAEMKLVRKVLVKICNDINQARSTLNELDKELGDGDTGETLSRGATAILEAISSNNLNLTNAQQLLIDISDILMRSMGGTSGAIFSIFFQCASNAFRNDNCSKNNDYSIHNWLQAISNGIDAIMRYGKAEIGDRTLLDSLYVGYNEMKMSCNEGNSLEACVNAFADGCRIGAENTKVMLPKSGRSAYTMADCDGTFVSNFPDSGAHAIEIISNGILTVLQGRNVDVSMEC